MKRKERPPKPLNIARKLNIKSKLNKEIVTFLKEFKTSPSHYFDSKFNNKPFIIGKIYSQSPYARDSDLSFSNIRTIKSGFKRKRTAKLTKTYSGNQTKTYITDNDLALIYAHARSRINDTEIDTDLGKTSKRPLSQFQYYLKQQENSLKHYHSFINKRNKLSQSIGKQIKCNPDMLLMHKQELFRPKKEVLDSISYKGFDVNTQFEYCLRHNSQITKRIEANARDTMIENTEGKIDKCQPKEIIRNPSYDLLCYNNTLSNNSYLKDRFASFDGFNSVVNKPNINLKKLKVKGVNLLLFEKSIADRLKGQKILYLEKRQSNILSSTLPIADKTNQISYCK